jgi:predicted GTPase
MATLTKIGIKEDAKFIASIGSSAMVGRTTLMLVIASELVNEGKNILFVSDDKVVHIMRKANKFMKVNKTGKFVVIGNYFNYNKPLAKIIEGHNYDYVFLDSFVFTDRNKIEDTISIVRSENFSTFISAQLRRIIDPIKTSESAETIRTAQLVDYVFVLTKKEKLNFFDKLKYWFRFAGVPNFTLNLIKNRFGKTENFDFHIDFDKLGKN